jgi:hypothetical protein
MPRRARHGEPVPTATAQTINMSTRQLRSQLKDPKTGEKRKLDFGELGEGGPPRQRPKRPQVLYHCLSCLVDMPSRSFHDYNPSPDCEHLINTCKECLSGWVDTQIDQNLAVMDKKDNTVFGIKCPECSASMQSLNVRAVASRKMYELFVKQQRNHLAETTPGWFWCQNRECSEGATLKDETVTVSTCAKCGTDSCVPCQRPAHPGESCDKYKARLQGRVDEEDKSLVTIRRASKPCPGCGIRIEKNGGCDHMGCEYTYYLSSIDVRLTASQAGNVVSPGIGVRPYKRSKAIEMATGIRRIMQEAFHFIVLELTLAVVQWQVEIITCAISVAYI